VLTPHIATLFKLLITKANVPRSWKEAKLNSYPQEGASIDPRELYNDCGEWDTIQTICQFATFHGPRLVYQSTNTTRSRTHNLGVILAERSTLHPLFVLQHLKDAAQKRQRGSSRLYPFLHELIAFYEQASSRTSRLKAEGLLCKPCKP
jgi:hypothetical protein